MALTTSNSTIIDTNLMLSGTASLDDTTIPSNEIILRASDAQAGDNLGETVAIGNGRIVLGSEEENGGSGDPINDAGAAYVYDYNGTELFKLTASDAQASDYFGTDVSVGHGRIVVGARGSGVGGAIYIFDLGGTELLKVEPSDAASGDGFGLSIDIGSGRIVVGAPLKDVGAANGAGAVYVFDLDGTELFKLTRSDAQSGDQFGEAVAIGHGRIVIGAYSEDGGAGDPAGDSGVAYLYDFGGTELAVLRASDAQTQDNFGESVDVGYGRIVVGAHAEGTNSEGAAYVFDLEGNELFKLKAGDAQASDFYGDKCLITDGRIIISADREDGGSGDPLSDSGAVYIYDLDGNELHILRASDAQASDFFGGDVDVADGKMVVGARFEDGGSGDPISAAGAGYVYDIPIQKHMLDDLDLSD